MAVFSNTQATYASKGNREGLSDIIYNIDPLETPFTSGTTKVDVSATKHEWQTDNLAAAAANAQLEGDDLTVFTAPVYTTRWDNYAQISRKDVIVSRTQDIIKKAGRKSEYNYQKLKKGQELKRDMEVALTQNGAYNAGAIATARSLRGLEGWVYTNDVLGASGVSPVPATNTAQTDGTARALTETLLQNVVQLAWNSGGSPDVIMCGGTQKQTISGFSGGSTRFNDMDGSKKLNTAIDFYASDFGTLKVIPNRFQRARTVWVLDMSMWKLGMLDDMQYSDLAKTGDANKGLITVEYTLESCNEAASGAIRDVI